MPKSVNLITQRACAGLMLCAQMAQGQINTCNDADCFIITVETASPGEDFTFQTQDDAYFVNWGDRMAEDVEYVHDRTDGVTSVVIRHDIMVVRVRKYKYLRTYTYATDGTHTIKFCGLNNAYIDNEGDSLDGRASTIKGLTEQTKRINKR